MEEQQRAFGWRQLLASVNLRDFGQMVTGEAAMIGGSLRRAVEVLPRLPFGPFISLGLILLAILRSILLAAVIIVFGVSITLISIVRSVGRLLRRPPA